ncbi:MAG: acetyl-CoA carboxylase biotin carboxyl carrier protein subunit [Acidobacteriota bacterium]
MRFWVARDGERVDLSVRRIGARFEVNADGRSHDVELLPVAPGLASLVCADGRSYSLAAQRLGAGLWRISLGDREFEVRLRDPLEREIAGREGVAAGPQEIRAPIPGKVVGIAVAPGDAVRAGQPLLILEAMKMENQIRSEGAGTVQDVLVEPGATVEGGQILLVLS